MCGMSIKITSTQEQGRALSPPLFVLESLSQLLGDSQNIIGLDNGAKCAEKEQKNQNVGAIGKHSVNVISLIVKGI